jgi:hypothetical protein
MTRSAHRLEELPQRQSSGSSRCVYRQYFWITFGTKPLVGYVQMCPSQRTMGLRDIRFSS